MPAAAGSAARRKLRCQLGRPGSGGRVEFSASGKTIQASGSESLLNWSRSQRHRRRFSLPHRPLRRVQGALPVGRSAWWVTDGCPQMNWLMAGSADLRGRGEWGYQAGRLDPRARARTGHGHGARARGTGHGHVGRETGTALWVQTRPDPFSTRQNAARVSAAHRGCLNKHWVLALIWVHC